MLRPGPTCDSTRGANHVEAVSANRRLRHGVISFPSTLFYNGHASSDSTIIITTLSGL